MTNMQRTLIIYSVIFLAQSANNLCLEPPKTKVTRLHFIALDKCFQTLLAHRVPCCKQFLSSAVCYREVPLCNRSSVCLFQLKPIILVLKQLVKDQSPCPPFMLLLILQVSIIPPQLFLFQAEDYLFASFAEAASYFQSTLFFLLSF